MDTTTTPTDTPCRAEEAEAALLALGPQLEWEKVLGDRPLSEERLVARIPGAIYRVFRLGASWGCSDADAFYAAEVEFPRVESRHKSASDIFNSPADAKAACERHFATGKLT